jgi:hypothetical protein
MKYIENKLLVAAFAASALLISPAQALEAQIPPAGASLDVIESTISDNSPVTTFALAGNKDQLLTVEQLMKLEGGLLIDTASPDDSVIVYSKDKFISGYDSFDSLKSELTNAEWFKSKYPTKYEQEAAIGDIEQAIGVIDSKYEMGSMQASVAPELEVPFEDMEKQVSAFYSFSKGEGRSRADYAMYNSDVVDMVSQKMTSFAPPGYRDKVLEYAPVFTGVHEMEHVGGHNSKDKMEVYAENFATENTQGIALVENAVKGEVSSDLIGMMAVKKVMQANNEPSDVFDAFVESVVDMRISEHLKESVELDYKLAENGRLRGYSRTDDDGVHYDRAKRDKRVGIFMAREHHISDIPIKATAQLLKDNPDAFESMGWGDMRLLARDVSAKFVESPEIQSSIKRAGSSITASMDERERELLSSRLYHDVGSDFSLVHDNDVKFDRMGVKGSEHHAFLTNNGFLDTGAALTSVGNAATYYSSDESVLPYAISTIYPNDVKSADIVFAVSSKSDNIAQMAYSSIKGLDAKSDTLNGQYLFKVELDEKDPEGHLQMITEKMKEFGLSPSPITPSRELVPMVPALSEFPDALRKNGTEAIEHVMSEVMPEYSVKNETQLVNNDIDLKRASLSRR